MVTLKDKEERSIDIYYDGLNGEERDQAYDESSMLTVSNGLDKTSLVNENSWVRADEG